MVRFALPGLVVSLVACDGKDPSQNPNSDDSGNPGVEGPFDADEDGVLSDSDCNDSDASIHPGASETCNGLDDDCNGTIDEDLLATFHRDADADGFGDAEDVASACAMPDGYVTDATDCNDADAGIHPGGTEVCDLGGVDEDCNGAVNEDDAGVSDIQSWYVDGDEDGYGDSAKTVEACFEAPGLATIGTDCNDADAAMNPGALELCDELDKDEDCDSFADVNDPEGPFGQPLYYVDSDGDDAGDLSDPGQYFCDGVPSGYSTVPTDCDDADDLIHPNAPEFCQDTIDNDCNGAIDDCGPIPDMSLSTADVSIFGTESWENMGFDVADLGDLDGDRIADFGSSSPSGTTDEGRGRIFSGPFVAGTELDADDEATGKISGTGNLGYTMRGAGDVDGDGFDDVIIGASRNNGEAFVFLGPVRGSVTVAAADAAWTGESNNHEAGQSVEGGFDYNSDGFTDYVIGAPNASITLSNEGAAYLVYGPGLGTYSLADADTRFVGRISNSYFGGSVAALGDTDGDGAGDLAVGAERDGDDDNGRAYVFAGDFGGSVDAETSASAWFEGEVYDNIAVRVADGGDFNDDGYADLLIGAPYSDGSGSGNSGTVYLIAGPMNASGTAPTIAYAEFYGEPYNSEAGRGIDGTMDLNRDGFTDVLVGAPSADYAGGLNGAGATYLVYGPQSGVMSLADARVNLVGEESDQFSGSAVAFIGDQDGDDSPEVLTGAQYTDGGSGTDSGAIYIVFGADL
jgi:hypothetical protein